MIYKDIKDILENEDISNRVLGIDLGTKTIGVALSDSSRLIASPMETIFRKKTNKDIDKIIEMINEHQVSALVLGYPINMDTTEGKRAQSTLSFAKEVEKKIDLPIILWDERLSTVAAEKVLIEADMSREKRKKIIDKMAATYILQGALDRIKFLHQN
tara:strand:- start:1801 stop:2274 length:474 start_codon:yes stop_codon:yes gene_type:complete